MAVTARKYNPGFLSDDELVASFCVRTSEFESIVEMLRECTGSSNPHQIVIGPRGSGKTSLLLRVAAEVRRNTGLSSGFFPIVFAEESYEVATAGEFWLECLSRLAAQASCREGDPNLRRTYEELRTIHDDWTLAERCLVTLLDFSDREGKRLVLMVENLNMMFRDMADADAGWRLRKLLQIESRIMLIATATSRFAEIDNPDHALYDLFRVLTLQPLDTNECAVLWETVSGRCPQPETIRSLEVLTGGSPRLIAIVARFGAERSFRELMADLLDLVDDHTEYFKSHIESLPAQERRVYLALAELWKPATTREVAARSRLETSKCSAQLTRLIERGVVQVAGGSARRKQYYLSERLYNIYYLMRRSRGPDSLIEALVKFMESYYSPHELRDIGARMAHEAESFDMEMRALHQTALARLMELPGLAGYRAELLAMIPEVFAASLDGVEGSQDVVRTAPVDVKPERSHMEQIQDDAQKHAERTVSALFGEAATLYRQNRREDAIAVYDEVVRQFGKSDVPTLLDRVAQAFIHKGAILGELNRPEETLVACDEVICRFGESRKPTLLDEIAIALVLKGVSLWKLNRPQEALLTSHEVMSRFGQSERPTLLEQIAMSLIVKGCALRDLERMEEALDTWDEVVRRFGVNEGTVFRVQAAVALVIKGSTLEMLNRLEEALVAYDDVVRRFEKHDTLELFDPVSEALFRKGSVLDMLKRPEEALAALDGVLHRCDQNHEPDTLRLTAMSLLKKGSVLRALKRPDEAMAAFYDVECRVGDMETPVSHFLIQSVLLEKADLELECGQYEAATRTTNRILDRHGTVLPKTRSRGYLIRAKAALANGDPSACEQDIESLLAHLPELDPLPQAELDALMEFSVDLGPARMRELILASPAANLLLPLTTALEWELDLEPRVAREIEEVAQDVRQELAELRERRAKCVGQGKGQVS